MSVLNAALVEEVRTGSRHAVELGRVPLPFTRRSVVAELTGAPDYAVAVRLGRLTIAADGKQQPAEPPLFLRPDAVPVVRGMLEQAEPHLAAPAFDPADPVMVLAGDEDLALVVVYRDGRAHVALASQASRGRCVVPLGERSTLADVLATTEHELRAGGLLTPETVN